MIDFRFAITGHGLTRYKDRAWQALPAIGDLVVLGHYDANYLASSIPVVGVHWPMGGRPWIRLDGSALDPQRFDALTTDWTDT